MKNKKIALIMAALSLTVAIAACGTKPAETTIEEEETTVGTTAEEITEMTDNSSDETEDADPFNVDGFYRVCSNLDDHTIETFAEAAKDAYLGGDWEKLSGMIRYPITMYPDIEVTNADEFISYMEGKSVSDSDREAMENETCTCIGANSQGICMGSGQIWLADSYDGTQPQIIALSGIS